MLGSFLELSVATPQIRESFAFYQRLGFESAIVNDIWSHPYGVLVSDALALGLHAQLTSSPALTFVKADVARLARELDARGIELTSARLGADSFNEIGFADAAGVAVRVLEARTFSPPSSEARGAGPLGRFDLLSMPARDPEAALEFWRALDYSVWDAEEGDWPRQAVAFGHLRGLPSLQLPHALLATPDDCLILLAEAAV
jgi:hypothetical protein